MRHKQVINILICKVGDHEGQNDWKEVHEGELQVIGVFDQIPGKHVRNRPTQILAEVLALRLPKLICNSRQAFRKIHHGLDVRCETVDEAVLIRQVLGNVRLPFHGLPESPGQLPLHALGLFQVLAQIVAFLLVQLTVHAALTAMGEERRGGIVATLHVISNTAGKGHVLTLEVLAHHCCLGDLQHLGHIAPLLHKEPEELSSNSKVSDVEVFKPRSIDAVLGPIEGSFDCVHL
mmetsp:Transcript_4119/g.6884  ORF Transcript_4119/g.6884 Transcript_4119/m.6884 type:complete len:234 (-) Transcript_4119:892-1593(-)